MTEATKIYYMREGDTPNRTPPFSLRLTKDERRKLEERAGSMPLASYIKSLVFAEDAATYRKRRKSPVTDYKALADVLSCLGASHIANNLNQLAKAAHIGDLYFDEETKRLIARACDDVAAMRQLLMQALGLKPPTEPPANETVSQTFVRASVPDLTNGKRFGI